MLYAISPFRSTFPYLYCRPAVFQLKHGKVLENDMMFLVNLKPSSVAVYTNYRVTSFLVPGDSGRLGTIISLISVESLRRNNLVLLNLSSGNCSVCVLNKVKKNMKTLYSVLSVSFLT